MRDWSILNLINESCCISLVLFNFLLILSILKYQRILVSFVSIFLSPSKKESLGATVKLLLCDLVVMGSSSGNSLLQCRVRLHIIDPFSGPFIGGNFMHRNAFLF